MQSRMFFTARALTTINVIKRSDLLKFRAIVAIYNKNILIILFTALVLALTIYNRKVCYFDKCVCYYFLTVFVCLKSILKLYAYKTARVGRAK